MGVDVDRSRAGRTISGSVTSPAGRSKIRAALPARIARLASSGMFATRIALIDDWMARNGDPEPNRTRSAPRAATNVSIARKWAIELVSKWRCS